MNTSDSVWEEYIDSVMYDRQDNTALYIIVTYRGT